MNVYTEAGGRVRGQVQLYAAPGFRALYLTNAERRQIYEEEMLPRLRDQQFGDALMVALARIDAAATGERAGQLQLARQTDAVIGIIGGLGGFLLLAGYAFFHWRRYGRDPYVVDSPSIYLPAPPAELTAAGGALLHDGSSSRRTLTTALLDLASRDELAFRATDRLIGADEVTIEIHPPAVDDPRIRLNRRNPTSPAEDYALDELGDASEEEGGVRVLDKTALLEFGKSVGDFDERLEAELVRRGWFIKAPGKVTGRWRLIGGVEVVAAIVAFWVGTTLPSGGFTLLALGLGAAGVFTFILAGAMPARTLPGATMKAMLAAYRRTWSPCWPGPGPWTRWSRRRALRGWRRGSRRRGRSPSASRTRRRRSSGGAWRTSGPGGRAPRICPPVRVARRGRRAGGWAAWPRADVGLADSRTSAGCSSPSGPSATRRRLGERRGLLGGLLGRRGRRRGRRVLRLAARTGRTPRGGSVGGAAGGPGPGRTPRGVGRSAGRSSEPADTAGPPRRPRPRWPASRRPPCRARGLLRLDSGSGCR